MSLSLQLPSSLTVGPPAPYKRFVSHSCIVRTCVDRDSTTWYFLLFYSCNLFTPGSQHKIFWQTYPIDIVHTVPESLFPSKKIMIVGQLFHQLNSIDHSLSVVHGVTLQGFFDSRILCEENPSFHVHIQSVLIATD